MTRAELVEKLRECATTTMKLPEDRIYFPEYTERKGADVAALAIGDGGVYVSTLAIGQLLQFIADMVEQ